MTLNGPSFRIPNSLRVALRPHQTYGAWRQKYGRSYKVKAVNGDVICTSDTAVIRDLFRANDDQVGPFRPDVLTPLLGGLGLFTLSGAAHARERKLLMPPFHGGRMRSYGELMCEVTESTTASWKAGDAVRMSDAMLDVSLAIIVRAVFGVHNDLPRWMKLLRGPIENLSPLALFVPMLQHPLVPTWRRFAQARDTLDKALFAEIAARRQSERGDDILSLMLDATYEDGTVMSDLAIRDELITLLFAGHETTQISMAWALHRIHNDRTLVSDLRDELDACDGSPTALAKLPLLTATVDETLRIDPIVPDVLRTLTVPMTLGDLELDAGTHVSPIAIEVHRDPELYPEPDGFQPRRFIGQRYRPWEYLPFGGGTRRCIGAALATYEMKVVLGTVLRQVELENAGEDWMVRKTITMAPKNGVPMRVVARRP